MFLLITAVLAIAVTLIYQYLVWSFDYWNIRRVPGPKPKPLLGNLPSAVWLRRNLTYDYHDIYQQFRERRRIGNFVGIFAVTRPQILLISPDVVQEVLVDKFDCFNANDCADIIDPNRDTLLAFNPFMLTGAKWRSKRIEIEPGFSRERVDVSFEAFAAGCRDIIINLSENPAKATDLKQLAVKFVNSCFAKVAFGANAQPTEVLENSRKLSAPTALMKLYFILITLLPPIRRFSKIRIVPRRVERYFNNLMQDAIDGERFEKGHLEFLKMLRTSNGRTSLELAAHSITFYLDGLEKTSLLIAFVLFELSQHQNVQNRLRKEIEGLEEGTKNLEMLNKIAYLDQILNEVLRLHPPIPILEKRCTKNTFLTLNNSQSILIEKGTPLAIPVYSIHRDDEFYVNPEAFNPDRFGSGADPFCSRGVFLPFGGGPRQCLGFKYALAVAKALVVEIVTNFQIIANDRTHQPIVMNPEAYLNDPPGLWAEFRTIK